MGTPANAPARGVLRLEAVRACEDTKNNTKHPGPRLRSKLPRSFVCMGSRRLHMPDQVLEVLKGTHQLVLDELPRIALLVEVLVLRELGDDVHGVGHPLLGHLRLSLLLCLLLLQGNLHHPPQLVLNTKR